MQNQNAHCSNQAAGQSRPSRSVSVRTKKICFSVTADQYRAAQEEAARLRIPLSELIHRRELDYLRTLEAAHAQRLGRLKVS